MAITVNRIKDVNGNTRPNQGGISWALWNSIITNAPNEEGSGLTTDSNGALTIPSVADSGYIMVRIDDDDMGLYLAE